MTRQFPFAREVQQGFAPHGQEGSCPLRIHEWFKGSNKRKPGFHPNTSPAPERERVHIRSLASASAFNSENSSEPWNLFPGLNHAKARARTHCALPLPISRSRDRPKADHSSYPQDSPEEVTEFLLPRFRQRCAKAGRTLRGSRPAATTSQPPAKFAAPMRWT